MLNDLQQKFVCNMSIEEQIEQIKQVIEEKGFELREEWFDGNETGVFSLQLRAVGTPFYSNGKGKTFQIAQISAYAEFLERLESKLLYRYYDNYTSCCSDASKDMDVEPFLYDVLGDVSETKTIKAKVNELLLITKKQDWITYKNDDNSKIYTIPQVLIDILYGSNGVAAHCTMENAFLTAVCETVERHVEKTIIRDIDKGRYVDITGNISCLVLDHIRDRLMRRDIEIRVLDFSYMEGLPVIGVLLINYQSKKYLLQVASSTDLNCAIEHAINEIFQGRSIHDVEMAMKDFFSNEYVSSEENFNNTLRFGIGEYGRRILLFDNYRGEKGIIWERLDSCSSEKEKIQVLLSAIHELQYDVYYRNVEVAGFNVCSVIIPRFSEVDELTENRLSFIISLEKTKRILGGRKFDKENLRCAEKTLSVLGASVEDTLKNIFNLPLAGTRCCLDAMNIHLIIAILNIPLGEYYKAYAAMDKYVKYLLVNCDDIQVVQYYSMIKDYLFLLSGGMAESDACKIMEKVYDKELLSDVLADVKSDTLFDGFPYIPCLDNKACTLCGLQSNCCIEGISELYHQPFALSV